MEDRCLRFLLCGALQPGNGRDVDGHGQYLTHGLHVNVLQAPPKQNAKRVVINDGGLSYISGHVEGRSSELVPSLQPGDGRDIDAGGAGRAA